MLKDKVNELFESQVIDWELAGRNYGQLGKVMTRSFGFDGFEIIVQFNPERMRSSAAKVDAKSIADRPCFLCSQNRPPEQRGVTFGGRMTVLVNPFPIFTRHLTITSESHTGQRILDSFSDMIMLAGALPDYVIFYNGPQCGASAPDHLHFQAGNRGFLPIEKDFHGSNLSWKIYEKNGIEIRQWKKYLRTLLTFKGNDPEALSSNFRSVYDNFVSIQPGIQEPMLNILAYRESGSWIIHFFPRKIHRPSQYFAEGREKILISPAAVDLGGVLITPREEDFTKISASDITDIFSQVCLDEHDLTGLLNGLK